MHKGTAPSPDPSPRGEALLRLACLLMAMVAVTYAAACGAGSSPTFVVPPTPAPPSPTPAPTAAPPVATQPTPVPTPDTCPTLSRWSSKIHNITDGANQPSATPVVGGHVTVDSTPLFAGRACNAEQDGCGGRLCEDPRGGAWTLHQGTSPTEVRENGYQFRIGPLKPGLHVWQVCPRSDAKDVEGERVLIGPDPCTQGEFTVPNS